MATEPIRGCGYRKVDGLYLCGAGHPIPCDRLPYELKLCPVCGSGVKFTRSLQWIDWDGYAGSHEGEETEHLISARSMCTDALTIPPCPVCYPRVHPQPYGLLWIGDQFYTPSQFISEAISMGISRRIAAVPRKLELGKTWVLLGHRLACGTRKNEQGAEYVVPGVFYAFVPTHYEKLVWERDAKPELIADLAKDNIKAIIIPDGDLDHDPETKLKATVEEKTRLANNRFFDAIRRKLAV